MANIIKEYHDLNKRVYLFMEKGKGRQATQRNSVRKIEVLDVRWESQELCQI